MTEKTLTPLEAYIAMYKFLEHEYKMTGSAEIGGMLGSLALLEDGLPADPSAWNDWIEAIEKINDGNSINLKITKD